MEVAGTMSHKHEIVKYEASFDESTLIGGYQLVFPANLLGLDFWNKFGEGAH